MRIIGALYFCIIYPIGLVLGAMDLLLRCARIENNPVSRWIDREEMYDEVSRAGD